MTTRTTTALLEDLHDPSNEAAWAELDARYRPILAAVAQRLGLDREDAADLAQDALTRFARAYRAGQYRRDRGRLRTWLIAIARNCFIDQQRRKRPEVAADSFDPPDEDHVTRIWEDAQEREVLRRALEVLRGNSRFDERTISAFEMVALRGSTARGVAESTGMTLNDVYLAKHRCLARLREIVREIDTAFDEYEPEAPR